MEQGDNNSVCCPQMSYREAPLTRPAPNLQYGDRGTSKDSLMTLRVPHCDRGSGSG